MLAVHQDYAHHITTDEPIEHVGDVVLFPWPLQLPAGFERVSTPLICTDRLDAFRSHWRTLAPVASPVNPKPIPDPPIDEDLD